MRRATLIVGLVFVGLVGCATTSGDRASAEGSGAQNQSTPNVSKHPERVWKEPRSHEVPTTSSADVEDMETLEVAYAATSVDAGTPLTAELVEWKSVPVAFLPPNPLLESEFDIYRQTPVRRSVGTDQMILTSDFAAAEVDSSLSSKIPKGERGYPIDVEGDLGVETGDRVDVLVTVRPDQFGGEKDEKPDVISVVALQKVVVLSVPDDSANGGKVVLSVTLDEAKLLDVARTTGRVTLLLRNRKDSGVSATDRSTGRQLLQNIEVINRQRRKRIDARRPDHGDKQKDDVEILRDSE